MVLMASQSNCLAVLNVQHDNACATRQQIFEDLSGLASCFLTSCTRFTLNLVFREVKIRNCNASDSDCFRLHPACSPCQFRNAQPQRSEFVRAYAAARARLAAYHGMI